MVLNVKFGLREISGIIVDVCLSCACRRAIYDLYQNLYDTWFKGQSQETIEKVKAFYQTQVSNSKTAIDFFIKC